MKKVVAMVECSCQRWQSLHQRGSRTAATDSDLSNMWRLPLAVSTPGSSDTKEGPNEVVQKLEDKFNVTLSLKTYDNESLNLDLSEETPRISFRSMMPILRVSKGKHAVNLEDYKDIAQTSSPTT